MLCSGTRVFKINDFVSIGKPMKICNYIKRNSPNIDFNQTKQVIVITCTPIKRSTREREIKRSIISLSFFLTSRFALTASFDTRYSIAKLTLLCLRTYLQKTFQTSDRVLQDHPETLDQKGCSECC